MKRFLIDTWGCQMNVHDSEKIAGILASLGYERTLEPQEADLILLNTCTVREKAAEKVFSRLGELRHLKLSNPELLIGVCGCVAQQEGEAIFRRAPYVDLVMGPRTISRLGRLIEQARLDGRSISLAHENDPVEFPSTTTARGTGCKAYVTVMEGCNKSCSYCIVPFTRGREAYRAPDDILAEAQDLVRRGYCEIELLGQNVNAYHHHDLDFAALLRMVDRVPGVRRLRFTTSHPGHLKRPIMDAMRDLPSVCNHLHLPVQSGSDRILKRMDRGYTRDSYLEKIAYLRSIVPGIAISTDLIVGFPGETDSDFALTLDLLLRMEFDQVFAFIYSPRPGTIAADLPDPIPGPVASERLARVLGLQEEIQTRRNRSLLGQAFEILLDGHGRGEQPGLKGRTRCNRIVHLPAGVLPDDRFVRVRITHAHPHSLGGVPLPGVHAA
jgi:tRNA-2-methylthio-N6-dimethylallyladenosine synthase